MSTVLQNVWYWLKKKKKKEVNLQLEAINVFSDQQKQQEL